MPQIRFATGQTGAMDSGLLPRTHPDGLPVFGKAYRIGLGIFQCNQGNGQIPHGMFGQVFVCRDHVCKQNRGNEAVVSRLFKSNTEHLLDFAGFRYITRIDFYNVVISFSFGF